MFIRKTIAKGQAYHSVVRGFRDEFGRVRHELIVSLGKSATVGDAIRATGDEIDEDRRLRQRVLAEARGKRKSQHGSPEWASALAGFPSDDDVKDLPKWAVQKAAALDKRIAENLRRLEILERLKGQLADGGYE